MKRTTFQRGSVVLAKRVKGPDVWVLRFRGEGKQPAVRLGTVAELPNKKAALKKALNLHDEINMDRQCITMAELCDRYQREGLPERQSSQGPYRSVLKRIRSQFGQKRITEFVADIQGLENWLNGLETLPTKNRPARAVARRTKGHFKILCHRIIECAMRWGLLDVQRNPIALSEIKGSNKRVRKLVIVPIDRYHVLLDQLKDVLHVRMMVQVAMCLGLRASEFLALRWEEVDLECLSINITRSVVGKYQNEETKTEASNETLPLHPDLAAELAAWKDAVTPINGWVFGSPITGRPYHRDALLSDHLAPAAKAAGMPGVGWHAFRHTYRANLRESGLPIEVQQKLMRHADIKTTLSYGGHMQQKEMRPGNAVVVERLRRFA
jgi:integrase